MSSLAERALSHYRNQRRIAALGVRAVRTATKAAQTPAQAKVVIPTTLATYQVASAIGASRAVASELGASVASQALSFAGTTALGYPITDPIETLVDRLTEDLDGEWQRITNEMTFALDRMVASEIIAAGVDAAATEIVAKDARYVRVLNLPSCKDCAILAGRIYRSEEAFERHVGCDCEHWPIGSEEEARKAGLILDPLEAFERGQIRGLSQADEQAIRDGADITTVVNATVGGGRKPGITNAVTAEIFGRTVKATTYGTTRRAAWRKANPKLPIRLRPQSIYAHAKDRDDALRLLRLYGYLR